MSKGEFGNYEGALTLGPWGGPEGDVWTYKPLAPITELIIVHGGAIDSLRFKSKNAHGLDEYSVKFGGNGGNRTDKIAIDSPLEYLTTISGACEVYNGTRVVRSLCFYTNLTKYGPFGSSTTGVAFSFPVESGIVVGFFGRAGRYIDAIGIYASPKSSRRAVVIPKQEKSASNEIRGVMNVDAMLPCEVRAWGGSGGKAWDDGVFSIVKQVCFDIASIPSLDSIPSYAVQGIQFIYVNRDGKTVSSPVRGHKTGRGTDSIVLKLDGDKEFLTGVAGFYGPIRAGHNGMEAITSITFYTNKAKYGPYGDELGTYFTCVASAGKVVGFHGRSGAYLNAIGVHTEYI